MINFSRKPPWNEELIAILVMALSSSFPPFLPQAHAQTKYKKETVVDFEESMVEGKSRKPYSAYLTQQKESSFANLHSWSLDIEALQDQQRQRVEAKQ